MSLLRYTNTYTSSRIEPLWYAQFEFAPHWSQLVAAIYKNPTY